VTDGERPARLAELIGQARPDLADARGERLARPRRGEPAGPVVPEPLVDDHRAVARERRALARAHELAAPADLVQGLALRDVQDRLSVADTDADARVARRERAARRLDPDAAAVLGVDPRAPRRKQDAVGRDLQGRALVEHDGRARVEPHGGAAGRVGLRLVAFGEPQARRGLGGLAGEDRRDAGPDGLEQRTRLDRRDGRRSSTANNRSDQADHSHEAEGPARPLLQSCHSMDSRARAGFRDSLGGADLGPHHPIVDIGARM